MATAIDILLVDDNPMICGLVRRALASFGEVQVATDATEALTRLAANPPDLVIVDSEITLASGQTLIHEIRQRPAHLPLVVLAARSAPGTVKSFDETIDEIVEKPFFVRDLRTRVKRVVDRILLERLARAAVANRVRGTLTQMSVIDLLQSLEMGRKSCCLTLLRHEERCEMYFSEGQLTHAIHGALCGDEAVYSALRWQSDGQFEINFEAATETHTTSRSTQGLLMEGLRLLDEANREAGGEINA